MTLTKRLIGFLLLCILFSGCAQGTFHERFGRVKETMGREEVVRLLGEPDKKTDAVIPNGPFWGPQEYLTSILHANAPYEEWQYQRKKEIFLIWFGSVEPKPKRAWKVIGKNTYPEGTVF